MSAPTAATASAPKSGRVMYREAGEAQRAAVERAMKVADKLKSRDWRVLVAVLNVTSSWSRLTDTVTLEQLADTVGLTKPRVSESLNRLAREGVIGWQSNRSPQGLSKVWLMAEQLPTVGKS